MTAMELLGRVKGWFGGGLPAARQWSPADGGAGHGAAEAVGATAVERTASSSALGILKAPPRAADAWAAPSADERGAADGSLALAAPPARLDLLDPPWMRSLESLPDRIAQSAVGTAAAGRRLDQIAGELEGHRQAARTMAAAARRLPEIAQAHAELTRETNKVLERQSLVMDAVLDGILSVRAALKGVEEGSRRHLTAIAELESAHREVLFEYQRMLESTHRRLGWIAGVGIVLGSLAVGGLAYVAWLVFVGR